MHDLSVANPKSGVSEQLVKSFDLDQVAVAAGFDADSREESSCRGGQVPAPAAARILPLASRARLGKERLPGVLAVAGTSVLAFRKPDMVGDHSFQDIRMDCSKGRKLIVRLECGRGRPACRINSILSKTVGA